MELNTVLNWIAYILIIIVGGISLWYKGNLTLNKYVTQFINDAEETYIDQTKAGGIKFQWVVTQLQNMLPAVIRPFIPVSLIESIVQSTFEMIESYAKIQLNKIKLHK